MAESHSSRTEAMDRKTYAGQVRTGFRPDEILRDKISVRILPDFSRLPYNPMVGTGMNRLRFLIARISLLATVFAGEALVATLFLDGATAVPSGSQLAGLIHSWGPSIARFAIAFSVLFATFTFLRYKPALKSLSPMVAGEPFRGTFFVAHCGAIGLFCLASMSVYGDHLPALNPSLAAITWIVAAAAAIIFAALAFLPWVFWRELVRATRFLWIYAAAASVLIWAATSAFRSLWRPASILTFHLVQLLLSVFVTDMVVRPDALRIGTSRFQIIIADECSGLEGIGLLLVFALMWLVLFREEARLPQALILLPLSIVTLFLLNAVRITGLILIGNAGARDIALGGFHSQAGWIAFNGVAFGSCLLARRWSWVSSVPVEPLAPPTMVEASSESTAAFLVPFLAILATGMISRATSGAFEWLYPVRVLATLGALWFFRRSYSRLDWKFGVPALCTGAAVFLLWIAADRISGKATPMPAALAGSSTMLRDGWIALRILGAVFTVPVAEELAFRGFLLRRVMKPDFDSVSFRDTSWLAILVSSILFGLMHGPRWPSGVIAGIAYAALIKGTGKMGDAVAAHAVTNGLLAVSVLCFGQWQLW
jgi:exosortase E/protease (VPEID-CTERM system)